MENSLSAIRMPLTAESESPLTRRDADSSIDSMVDHLHHAWSQNAPFSVYARLRDDVLRRRDLADTSIATLNTVVRIVWQSTSRESNEPDDQWHDFFLLAREIEATDTDRTRKCKGDQTLIRSTRNLAVVAALWSPQVVRFYGWKACGANQAHRIRQCAVKYPRFTADFLPRLNTVLLRRHRSALRHGRDRTLNEVPLQPLNDFDLSKLALADQALDESFGWLFTSDGHVPINEQGLMLSDVRPNHIWIHLLRKDRFGMLVCRDENADLQTPFCLDPKQLLLDVESSSVATGDTISEPNEWPCLRYTPDDQYQRCERDSSISSLETTTPLISEERHQNIVALRHGNESSLHTPCDDSLFCISRDLDQRHYHSYTSRQQTLEKDSTQVTLSTAAFEHNSNSQTLLGTAQGDRNPQFDTFRALPPHITRNRTIEGTLVQKYHSLVATYLDSLSGQQGNFSGGYSGGYSLQAESTQRVNLCATTWATPGSVIGRGSASKGDAEVLYYSSAEFELALGNRKAFEKPIVIKESFTDSRLHSDSTFLEAARDVIAKGTLRGCAVDGTGFRKLVFDDFGELLQLEPECDAIRDVLQLRSFTKSHKPVFAMSRRFRVLETLTQRIQGRTGQMRTSDIQNVESLLSFNLWGPHNVVTKVDFTKLGGTWIRNLSDVLLWMITPAEDMATQWTGKTRRLIVLEQDDVLLLPPGLRVCQAVHAPDGCLLEGGTIIDECAVVPLLQSLEWACKNRLIGDGEVAFQIQPIICELSTLIEEQPHRFAPLAGEREELQKALSTAMSSLYLEMGASIV